MNQKRKKELIMDYYLKPRFKKNLGDKYETFYSSRCADELKVAVEYENNKVKNVFWDGQGCAIFVASTELFIETITNKDKKTIKQILDEYLKMLQGKSFDKNMLKNLIIFQNVNKEYNRLACASMISDFFQKEL